MFRLGKILFLGTEAGTIQDPLKLVGQRPSVAEEKVMRTYLFAIVSAAFITLPTSAFSQDIEFGAGGVRVYPYHRHHGYGADCRELREACLHKDTKKS
jgi:hypothetical protein